MNRTIAAALTLAVSGCATDAPTEEIDPDLAVDVTALRCATSAAMCQSATAVIDTFSSRFEVDTRLAGAWRFCGGADDHGTFGAGVELTPAREVYVLEAAEDGSCRRSTATAAARWYTFDISEQNPDGTYQLVLAWSNGSTTSLVPTFTSSALGLVDGFAGFEFHRLRSGVK